MAAGRLDAAGTGTSNVAANTDSRTPWEMPDHVVLLLYDDDDGRLRRTCMVTAQLRPIATIYGQDKAIVWFGHSSDAGPDADRS